MMEELKACPHCNGKAAIYGVDSYYVACCRCEAQTKRYKTAKEAVKNWNRRAAPENTRGKSSAKAAENGSSTASIHRGDKPLTCDGCVGKLPHKYTYWACQTCLRNKSIKDQYESCKPEGSEKK